MFWNRPHYPYVSKSFTLLTWSYLGQHILNLHPDIFRAHIKKSSGYFLLEVTSNLAYSTQNSLCFHPSQPSFSECPFVGLLLLVF